MMGAVTEALKGTQVIVGLDNRHEVLAYPCGKMRKHTIRLLLGDRVKVEISPYDLTRACHVPIQARPSNVEGLDRCQSEQARVVHQEMRTRPGRLCASPGERERGRAL